MKEKIEKLITQTNQYKSQDISHPEFGSQNDFSEANEIKNRLLDFHLRLLNDIQLLIDNLPDGVINNYINTISSHQSNINSQIQNVNNLIQKGIHNPDYPNQRTKFINEFIKFDNNYIKNLYDIDLSLRLEKIENQIKNSDILQKSIEASESKLKEIETSYEKAKKILGDIRDLSFVKSLKESAGTFDKLRNNHTSYEKNWFIAFISSALITTVIVIFVFLADYPQNNLQEVITLIVKKILILSLPIIGMRICLKKYNLERNLKIIYDHRATVLEQYKSFENAIGDDREGKNLFRLEIAKYIFSDPITGYV